MYTLRCEAKANDWQPEGADNWLDEQAKLTIKADILSLHSTPAFLTSLSGAVQLLQAPDSKKQNAYTTSTVTHQKVLCRKKLGVNSLM